MNKPNHTPFHHQPLAQRCAWALAAVSLAVLAACGGGGGGGSTDTGTTPPGAVTPPTATGSTAVSGTITGFGSVIVDGKKYDDSVTTVSVGADPAAPSAGALTDLKLGMHIEGMVRDGQLVAAHVESALNGPVAAIDLAAGTFSVYGQTVKVVTTGATPTVFDGASGLGDLAAGDVVEVHGTPDATRVVSATRIERKPRSEGAGTIRLGGVVGTVDTAAKTFRLNDMTIDYSAATLLPTGAVPTAGQMFAAYGDTAPAAGVFRAKTVKLIKAEDGGAMEVGGRIMAFTSVADFSVSGVKVDASTAAFEGGTAADLAAGVVVGASGTVTNGVLKATKLRVLKTSTDVLASLKGPVTDFVSAGSFKVRGSVVDASAGTVVFTGGSAADLGNGAWVTVKGKVVGETLKADEVEFQTPPVAKPVTLKGEIRDLDLANASFKFLGVTVKLASGVTFTGGTTANLANGRRVVVTGVPAADGVVTATSVTFLGDLAQQPSVLGGRVADLTTSSFKLPGGLTVTWTGSTTFEGGTAADLANGVQVLAKGPVNGATKTMAATWIEVEQALPSGVRVAGAVGDYVSASDFRIGGQKVDASAAEWKDGSASDLGNGKVVEVRGSIVDAAGVRVVRATALRFLTK